ncbi:amidohydrolase family protein [Agromyces mediolanus]|uniref:amidohydrolase family protein n=1 Tax=Agromyces mediolanus TaxID=41986 RepID=UPI00203A3DBA|nr:amidohydrolase family protein [Agromyces mediolanus]MCM3657779.1 amidohydrolase family protein [Agromyces mediolanus]
MDDGTKILLRGGTVLTLDDEATVHEATDVLIEGDRIAAIGPALDAPGAEVIDAAGAIVSPGLVDSHIHMWQYPWRGTMQRKWGAPYIEKLYRMRPSYTPQDTYDATVGAAYAMLDLGVTGALDYLHGANQTPAHLDASVDAHVRAGMRVALGYSLTLNADARDDVREPARRARLEDLDRLRVDTRVLDSPTLDLALATVNPTDELMPALIEEFAFARERGLQITIHQNDYGEVAALHRAGLLGPDLVVVHSNPISERELDWMAETGVVMSVTSQSESLSGKTMMPTRKAFRRGVRLAFGVDSAVFTPLNLRTDLKAVFNALTTLDGDDVYRTIRMPVDPELDPATVDFEDVLRAGSAGGAYAIGTGGRQGVVAVGQLADIAVIRPRDPEPALADPAAYLLLGAPPADEVETVLVGGRPRKRDGRLLGIEPEELAELNSRVRRRAIATYEGR